MIILKKTEEKDIENIYTYIHYNYVKKYYLGKEKEQWEIHKKWYKFVIKSNFYNFYTVIDENNNFLGCVKFEIDGEIAIINIYLIEKIRGKKNGEKVIKISLEKIQKERPGLAIILAYILKENLFSEKVFRKSGFVFDCIEKYKGTKHMLFIKCLN